jgi:hypothetical protein
MRETLISAGHAHEEPSTYDTTDLVAEYRRRRTARRSLLAASHSGSDARTAAPPASAPSAPSRHRLEAC